MQEPYNEGLADHIGPESCGYVGNDMSEALTGAHAGWVLSRERIRIQGADPVGQWGRQHGWARLGECPIWPCVVVDPMHAWKLHARKPGYLQSGRPGDGAVRIGKADEAEADDARAGEVRLLHSTEETDEQSRATGGGAGGGKGGGQGERGSAKHAPDTGPEERVTGVGPCTRGRKAGWKAPVQGGSTPRQCRTAHGIVPGAEIGRASGRDRV